MQECQAKDQALPYFYGSIISPLQHQTCPKVLHFTEISWELQLGKVHRI